MSSLSFQSFLKQNSEDQDINSDINQISQSQIQRIISQNRSSDDDYDNFLKEQIRKEIQKNFQKYKKQTLLEQRVKLALKEKQAQKQENKRNLKEFIDKKIEMSKEARQSKIAEQIEKRRLKRLAKEKIIQDRKNLIRNDKVNKSLETIRRIQNVQKRGQINRTKLNDISEEKIQLKLLQMMKEKERSRCLQRQKRSVNNRILSSLAQNSQNAQKQIQRSKSQCSLPKINRFNPDKPSALRNFSYSNVRKQFGFDLKKKKKAQGGEYEDPQQKNLLSAIMNKKPNRIEQSKNKSLPKRWRTTQYTDEDNDDNSTVIINDKKRNKTQRLSNKERSSSSFSKKAPPTSQRISQWSNPQMKEKMIQQILQQQREKKRERMAQKSSLAYKAKATHSNSCHKQIKQVIQNYLKSHIIKIKEEEPLN